MIWTQAVVKGVLKQVGTGHWSGDTFSASVIEIGSHSIENVRMAKCLLQQMQAGEEMELLICSAHIYGVKGKGTTYKEGAARQLGWALLITVSLGWLLVPLLLSFVFVRRYYTIYSF